MYASIRILVADDFAEWRVRLRSIMRARPQWQVIGEACNGLEAVQRSAELLPDIALLDIGMPILNGIEAATRIREASPGTRVIFVTQESEAAIRTAALATGAEGYILKANAARQLLPAVEALCGMLSAFTTPATEQSNHRAEAVPSPRQEA
jgi:DNA-binding NarL/FixJ family response regulator